MLPRFAQHMVWRRFFLPAMCPGAVRCALPGAGSLSPTREPVPLEPVSPSQRQPRARGLAGCLQTSGNPQRSASFLFASFLFASFLFAFFRLALLCKPRAIYRDARGANPQGNPAVPAHSHEPTSDQDPCLAAAQPREPGSPRAVAWPPVAGVKNPPEVKQRDLAGLQPAPQVQRG